MLQLAQLLQSIQSNEMLPIESIEFVDHPIKCEIGFIGDIHNCKRTYLTLRKQARYTIQLGDLSNSSNVHNFFTYNDHHNHKYITGNHDWLDHEFIQPPNNLGDYGVVSFADIPLNIGYIRGANSVDKNRRMAVHIDKYHENEELSYEELDNAINFISSNKPDIIVTHMAPYCVHGNLRLLSNIGLIKSKTMMAFESLFNDYKPSLWIFGHYHQNMVCVIDRTVFVCVNMNEMMPLI